MSIQTKVYLFFLGFTFNLNVKRGGCKVDGWEFSNPFRSRKRGFGVGRLVSSIKKLGSKATRTFKKAVVKPAKKIAKKLPVVKIPKPQCSWPAFRNFEMYTFVKSRMECGVELQSGLSSRTRITNRYGVSMLHVLTNK